MVVKGDGILHIATRARPPSFVGCINLCVHFHYFKANYQIIFIMKRIIFWCHALETELQLIMGWPLNAFVSHFFQAIVRNYCQSQWLGQPWEKTAYSLLSRWTFQSVFSLPNSQFLCVCVCVRACACVCICVRAYPFPFCSPNECVQLQLLSLQICFPALMSNVDHQHTSSIVFNVCLQMLLVLCYILYRLALLCDVVQSSHVNASSCVDVTVVLLLLVLYLSEWTKFADYVTSMLGASRRVLSNFCCNSVTHNRLNSVKHISYIGSPIY